MSIGSLLRGALGIREENTHTLSPAGGTVKWKGGDERKTSLLLCEFDRQKPLESGNDEG
jgi:hypothetical protein